MSGKKRRSPEAMARHQERRKERLRADPEYRRRFNRRKQLRRKYGISPADFDTMMEAQEGKCDICTLPPKEDEYLDIDHDHENNFVRGLLCRDCNYGLGRFKDDPRLLQRAIQYLRKNGRA